MKLAAMESLIGERVGKLTVIGIERSDNAYRTYMLRCRCDCGNKIVTRPNQIASVRIKSCGCIRFRHGMSRTREHRAWTNMRVRCYNPEDANYSYIGGRGITVCDSWNPATGGSFSNFLADLGPIPGAGYFLDRADHDADYTPENCRWSRGAKARERRHTIDGETMTTREWATHWGISRAATYSRLARGWNTNNAMN